MQQLAHIHMINYSVYYGVLLGTNAGQTIMPRKDHLCAGVTVWAGAPTFGALIGVPGCACLIRRGWAAMIGPLVPTAISGRGRHRHRNRKGQNRQPDQQRTTHAVAARCWHHRPLCPPDPPSQLPRTQPAPRRLAISVSSPPGAVAPLFPPPSATALPPAGNPWCPAPPPPPGSRLLHLLLTPLLPLSPPRLLLVRPSFVSFHRVSLPTRESLRSLPRSLRNPFRSLKTRFRSLPIISPFLNPLQVELDP